MTSHNFVKDARFRSSYYVNKKMTTIRTSRKLHRKDNHYEKMLSRQIDYIARFLTRKNKKFQQYNFYFQNTDDFASNDAQLRIFAMFNIDTEQFEELTDAQIKAQLKSEDATFEAITHSN